MDKPRCLEVVKQGGQLRELDRLPDRQTRNHHHNAYQNDTDVENLLDRVVVREVIVIETKSQRVADGCNDLGRSDREELLPKGPGHKSIAKIDQSVEGKRQHAKEIHCKPCCAHLPSVIAS